MILEKIEIVLDDLIIYSKINRLNTLNSIYIYYSFQALNIQIYC